MDSDQQGHKILNQFQADGLLAHLAKVNQFKPVKRKNQNNMSRKKNLRTAGINISLSNRFGVLSSKYELELEMKTQSVHAQPRELTKTKSKIQVIPIVPDITTLTRQQTSSFLKLVKETLPTLKMKYLPGKIIFYTTFEMKHNDSIGSLTQLKI